MFGWEFPPKIYGGLAVASYGITHGLSKIPGVETTFCMPKPCGEEDKFLNIVAMNEVPGATSTRIISEAACQSILLSSIIASATISMPTSATRASTTSDVWTLQEDIPQICMRKSTTSASSLAS